MDNHSLVTLTNRQIQIELVRRACVRGANSLHAARAVVAALEIKQASRHAELARQLDLDAVEQKEIAA
jgi:hypothetical protein